MSYASLLAVLIGVLVGLICYLVIRIIQFRQEQRLYYLPSLVYTPRDYFTLLVQQLAQEKPEEAAKIMQALQRVPDQRMAAVLTSQVGHAVDKTGRIMLTMSLQAPEHSVVKTVVDFTMRGIVVRIDYRKGLLYLQRTEEQPLVNVLPYMLYKYYKQYCRTS